jgi:hypothetical protein
VEVYAGGRPEERSRLTLEWTSRFSGVGWCSWRRRSCQTGIEAVVIREALVEADGIGALRPLLVVDGGLSVATLMEEDIGRR